MHVLTTQKGSLHRVYQIYSRCQTGMALHWLTFEIKQSFKESRE